MKHMSEEAKDLLTHLVVLYDEIDVQKSRVRPHDTGYIKTTISVLESRVKEIKAKLLEME